MAEVKSNWSFCRKCCKQINKNIKLWVWVLVFFCHKTVGSYRSMKLHFNQLSWWTIKHMLIAIRMLWKYYIIDTCCWSALLLVSVGEWRIRRLCVDPGENDDFVCWSWWEWLWEWWDLCWSWRKWCKKWWYCMFLESGGKNDEIVFWSWWWWEWCDCMLISVRVDVTLTVITAVSNMDTWRWLS